MTGLTPAAARELFPGTRDHVYLNTAAEGLAGSVQEEGMRRYATDRRLGAAGRPAFAAVEQRCRERVADLLACSPEEIAFLASTARGVDAVVQTIDWCPGDNILVNDLEYPTNAYAGLRLAARGVETRVVPARGDIVDLDDLADRIDGRTRLVIASLVSYKSGFKHDLERLAAVVHAGGAQLLVDAVQAVGAIPVEAGDADFLVAASYKWLLGSHGVGVLYVNRALHATIEPAYVGWRGVVDIFTPDRFDRYTLHPDARRFEEGMPNYLGLYVLERALELLGRVGVEAVAHHDAALAQRLLDGYERLGRVPLTPRDPARRAGIVAVEEPRCVEIAARLAEQRILVWGKDGRIRVAPHLYNTSADVDAYLDAFAELTSAGRAA